MQMSLHNINIALESRLNAQEATISSMSTQLSSVNDYNKLLQQTLADINNKNGDPVSQSQQNCEGSQDLTKQRLSELLISDKLIHEENTKVIAELKESSMLKDQEIANLKAVLDQAKKNSDESDKKMKSQAGQIHTLKLEAREAKQELNKMTKETECLNQKLSMQKVTQEQLFRELD